VTESAYLFETLTYIARRLAVHIYEFVYLFIYHDGMQPESYGPLEKQIECLERERTNNPEVMPSSPMNKCKMRK